MLSVRLGYDCGLWSKDSSWKLFNGPKPVRFDIHWSNFRMGYSSRIGSNVYFGIFSYNRSWSTPGRPWLQSLVELSVSFLDSPSSPLSQTLQKFSTGQNSFTIFWSQFVWLLYEKQNLFSLCQIWNINQILKKYLANRWHQYQFSFSSKFRGRNDMIPASESLSSTTLQ